MGYEYKTPYQPLRLHLSFNEGKGHIAHDESPYGNHCYLGSPTLTSYGYEKLGIMLDESSIINHTDTINIGKLDENGDPEPFEINGYFLFSGLSNGNIISKKTDSNIYPIYVYYDANKLNIEMKSNTITLNYKFDINVDMWYKFTISRYLNSVSWKIRFSVIQFNEHLQPIETTEHEFEDDESDFSNTSNLILGTINNCYFDELQIVAGTKNFINKPAYDTDDENILLSATLNIHPLLSFLEYVTDNNENNVINQNDDLIIANKQI